MRLLPLLPTNNQVHWDVRAQALAGGDERCTDGSEAYRLAHFVMQVLPFWVRLMQCCRAFFDSRERRHLANALKYCTSIVVILLSLSNMVKVPVFAVLQLARCAFLGRAWRLRAAWYSQSEAPASKRPATAAGARASRLRRRRFHLL